MTENTQAPAAEAKKSGENKPANREGEQRRRRPSNRSNQNRNRNRQKPKEGEPRNEGEARKEGENPNRNRGNRGSNRAKSGNGGNSGRSGGSGQNRNRRRNAPAPTEQSLLENARKNEEAQKARLNPHLKIDTEAKAKVRITPLGGLGEIGGNMMVMETDNEAILIDVGMSFPDGEMHGVDILVPDFTYVREIKDKIVGVIITHAHEDHIGAVPYLFKEMQFPLYGTALPLAMIGNKFDEHHLKEFRRYFRPIEKRTVYQIGNDFQIEWMHMTHSIIDSSAIAVTTEAGTIIHTGDFKIDHTPVDGFPADLHRLAHYGEQGVLALLSDSTNSYNKEVTPSELSVAPALDRVFSKTKGRIILSTFSSNIHRVFQAIQAGIKYGRKVCVIGRSMERNLEVAMQYEYIKLPKNIFVDADDVSRMNDKDVLIITTGSQGEPNSALYRTAIGEHRHIKIKPDDLIILSSRAIPGNEGSISQMLNHLERSGAKVARDRDLHVSGHASSEEQKLMLRLVQPKFFLPVHGEYNHVMRHRETGIACGVPERNIYLMSDGECVEVAPKHMRKVKTVKSGKTYIDNQSNALIEDDIVIDRQKMATEGMVMIVAQVSKDDSHLISKPKVSSFGLVPDKQDKAFAQEMEDVLEHFLTNLKPGILDNPKVMESDLRQVVRKHIYRKMKKYPLIVPTLFVM